MPWLPNYNLTRFTVTVPSAGEVFFVLSQADRRYFLGLEGRFTFTLDFIVCRKDPKQVSRIARGSAIPWLSNGHRSVSTSAILDPGFYEVSMKIEAQYRTVSAKRRVYSTEDAIQLEMTERPAKVQEVAQNLQWVLDRVTDEGEDNHSQDDAQDVIGEDDNGIAGIVAAKDVADAAQHPDADPVQPKAPNNPHNKAPPGAQHARPDLFDQQQRKYDVDMQRQLYRPMSDPSEAPWNAHCVVGLRVYSQCPDVKIEIQTPWTPVGTR